VDDRVFNQIGGGLLCSNVKLIPKLSCIFKGELRGIEQFSRTRDLLAISLSESYTTIPLGRFDCKPVLFQIELSSWPHTVTLGSEILSTGNVIIKGGHRE
jgi:hypothetical protein